MLSLKSKTYDKMNSSRIWTGERKREPSKSPLWAFNLFRPVMASYMKTYESESGPRLQW